MRDKTREQILREVGEQIKTMVKKLLERLMREERALYLAEHPTKANGYYTRDLLTLVGLSRICGFPGGGKASSIPKSYLIGGAHFWSFRKPFLPCRPQG